MKLKEKVVIITGASSGIGEGIAKRFIEEGAIVIGCGIENEANLKEINYIKADITNYLEAEKIVKKTIELYGRVDSLINCAGVTGVGNLETTSIEEFQRQININLNGVFYMCKAAILEIKKVKGTVINIASDLGIRAIPDRVSYCPSKAAVISLTKCIALDYAPYVRANTIMPGLVETPMLKERLDSCDNPTKLREDMANIYPLKRMGRIEDMANAAVFLASDDSSFITGDDIAVCGGAQI